MESTEFNVEMKDQCQTCGEIAEVNENRDCPICWHNKIAKEFPFVCRSKGYWKAFKDRDSMPLPSGNW